MMKCWNRVFSRSSMGGIAARAWAPTAIALVLLVGCTPDTAVKTSHFEHDHVVAAHWPADLADVAVKLRERLAIENASESTRHEIAELISWTAEVAADTNLAEADWLPLYNASESLASNLRAAKGDLTDENRKQIESLCDLVDEAVNKIPPQLNSLAKDQS
ncbi:hypothetical protein Rcae01_00859 [Novipirellula caenicola]|uniref:Imelysin n=2 Tax=Novipirellula caenicola TaxID=1536901 RepID=A0ABP9VJN3_9BACT